MNSATGRFSGWRIVALSTLCIALTGPGQTIGVSVFIDWFVVDLDLSRATISTAYLIGTLGGGLSMPKVGQAVDRYGVRRSITVIGVLFSLALAFMSGVTGVLWLTLGFFGIRLLGQGSLSLASTVAVAHWFERRRGVVIGLTMTVGGALMALVPVGLNAVIEASGWRSAWLVAAVIVAVTVVPMGRFGFIDRPEDVGQTVDGLEPEVSRRDGDRRAASSTVGEAVRSRRFWVVAAVTGTSSMLVTAFNFHQIALLGEAGLSPAVAAAMFLPQVLGTAVAGLATGAIADRVGTRYIPALAMSLLIVAQFFGGAVAGGGSAVLYAIALGATGGSVRTMSGALLPAWFGTAHLGAIQGVVSFVSVVASAVGPLAMAISVSSFGSYSEAIVWSSAISLAVLVFTLTVPSPVRSRVSAA